MEKNYYKVLQVNQNASQEVIERVYKLLAKKYHPDLQSEENKEKSAEKFKEINEAYQVLSDKEKRKQYDQILKNESVSEKEISELYNENRQLRNTINEIKKDQQNKVSNQNIASRNNVYQTNNNIQYQQYNPPVNNNENQDYQRQQQKLKKEYYRQQEFEQEKMRIKNFLIDKLKGICAIMIIIVIIFIILQLPFVKNYFNSIYQDNQIIKSFVDAFIKIFTK